MSKALKRREPAVVSAETYKLLHKADEEGASRPKTDQISYEDFRFHSRSHMKPYSRNCITAPDQLEGLNEHSRDTDAAAQDDTAPKCSFKGKPPDVYSPKQEFIYTSALVKKWLWLTKTYEWWLSKSNYNTIMSTHWWAQTRLWIILAVLLVFGIVIFHFCYPHTASSTPRLYAIDMPNQFSNDTNIVNWGDENYIEGEDEFTAIQDIGDDNLNTFVTPIKIHNFSLNAEDLLFESMRHSDSNTSLRVATSAFSQTGTFRTKSSQIWDPHPEYVLNVFGQKLQLVLHQDTSFIPHNTFRVLRILDNRTEESDDEKEGHFLGCYYKGYVQGDNQSAVAVSLCSGMTGYIKTRFGTMLIQPVNQTDSDTILHRVWRHSQRNPRHAVSDLDLELKDLAESLQTHLPRRKRDSVSLSNQVYTLEVLIAVDKTMEEFHKGDLMDYILTLFSIVSNIFADASIGNSIRISLIQMIILKDYTISDERPGSRRSASTPDKLKQFCLYLGKKGFHYDTAMLITRDKICNNEREERCSTLGLAELGTVCKARSCSIVQDNGLPAAFTIAHELGHILNMPHDDDDRCKPHNAKSSDNRTLHIMSSVMGDHMHPWSWSKCSQYYVSEFLERTDKSCLENTPSTPINLTIKQPGEIYSLDHQCQLIHGNQSSHCTVETDCRKLFCNANSVCRSSNLPWADGTPCRNSNRYWCQKGYCVSRMGVSPQIVHGGWGRWSPFTPCSLTCGGGVQESRRECNNPLPANGGKYCVGSRKKYRSCNTRACPPGTVDPREQQCYDMNGKNFRIPGIDPASKWIPKYGLKTHVTDKCKLYCRLEDNSAYFLLQDMVKDGTTCTVDSFDKCVNGICRPAGCDNELNSIAKLDKCGVCEGRNDTCEEYTGSVNVSDLLKQKKLSQSLYYVTTIPKGASNIIITQTGYPEQNYIVLSGENDFDLLNSDKVVTPYAKRYSYAGVTLDYNGSNSTVERVNTTYAWKLTRDLIVKIISIDLSTAKNQDTVLISYTYTLDKPFSEPEVEIYRWQMQSWSSCDSLCQGTRHRLATCISTTQGLKVAAQFCDESAMPQPEYNSCNTDCNLTLNTTSISECSPGCGEFNCIQTFNDNRPSNIVDMSYCQLKFDVARHEPCYRGCWNYTDWSACTKSCGTGTQVREQRCYVNRTPVSDEFCNPRTRYDTNEPNIRACNMQPCIYSTESPIYQRSINYWHAEEWGKCSDWCKMNRTVTCAHAYGGHCPMSEKPKEVRNCCHIKYISEWGQCSVECGSGIRHKVQRCARVYKPDVPGAPKRKEIIDDSYCKALKVRKPVLRRSTKVCKISCKWTASEWTRCSKDCNEDYQTRYVHCEAWSGNRVNDRSCNIKKRPIQRKLCDCVKQRIDVLTACDCDGFERRRISYYNYEMKRYVGRPKKEYHKCTPAPKCKMKRGSIARIPSNVRTPSVSRSPSIVSSVSDRFAKSCADLQRIHRKYTDGEYMMYVRSRPVRIYCHQMNSRTPREYITVEPQENYSIYFEYKTRLTNSCPPISREHEYANDQNSGRTHFNKLRLNITDLRIIENDFDFSESRGQRQALGSAGDCYNRNMNCPQGDFSISLDRTGFVLRPGTVWNTYGSRAVMKHASSFDSSSTSRRAFCGGYCGSCRISATSGLYVDVV